MVEGWRLGEGGQHTSGTDGRGGIGAIFDEGRKKTSRLLHIRPGLHEARDHCRQ